MQYVPEAEKWHNVVYKYNRDNVDSGRAHLFRLAKEEMETAINRSLLKFTSSMVFEKENAQLVYIFSQSYVVENNLLQFE